MGRAEMIDPHADRFDERNADLARQLTWHAWIAARSFGLAALWVAIDGDEICYGLVRSGNVEEE
jgi:hypothetical protein